MTPIADRPVAVLDANVLFRFRLRDTLLRFRHAGLFQARAQHGWDAPNKLVFAYDETTSDTVFEH